MKAQNGFTLLETMSVVGIIGTVASIGIPAYHDYLGRAQVTEAVLLASAARTVVTEHYATQGEWPDALPTEVTASARYTAVIELVAEADSPAATLTVTLKSAGVQRDIQGKSIQFETADGGGTWECRAVDISARVLPQACRN